MNTPSQKPGFTSALPGDSDSLRARREDQAAVHRYRTADSLDAEIASLADDWLSERELRELSTRSDAARRGDWLRGRLLGKSLIAERSGDQLQDIEILSIDADGKVNRPRVFAGGVEQPWSLSISHTERGVLAALSTEPGVTLGVDVVPCQPLSAGFGRLWFTAAEQYWIERTGSPGIACFIWGAKESLYKALNRGESFAPLQFEVLPDGTCRYRNQLLTNVRLRSWHLDGHVAVLASAYSARQSIAEPILSAVVTQTSVIPHNPLFVYAEKTS